MSDLDHLPLTEDEMSDEEKAIYLAVIRSAYPAPKTDIRAAVMEKIRLEKNNGKILSGIPSASAKKSKFTKAFVKWGSLAACAAIVCLAGIRILPVLTAKTENMAADAADFEYFSYTEDGSVSEDSVLSDAYADTNAAEGTSESSGEIMLRQYAAATTNCFTVSEDCDENAEQDITEEAAEDTGSVSAMLYSTFAESPASDAEIIEEAAEAEEKPAEKAADIAAMFENDLKEKLVASSGMKLDITRTIAELIDEIGISQQEFDAIYDSLAEKYRADDPDVMLPVYLIDEGN